MIIGINAAGVPISGGAGGISFVGSKTFAIAAETAFDFTGLTGGSDTQPSAGDYLIITAGRASNGDLLPYLAVTPTGIDSTPFVSVGASDSVDCGHRVWEGIYEAATAAGGTLGSSSGRGAVYSIFAFRGALGRNGVAAATFTANNSGNANPPAVTPTVAGSWIFASGFAGHNNGAQQFDFPADLTNALRNVAAPTYCCSGLAGMKTDWESGSFNPAVFTGLSADSLSSNAASTFVIQPS